MMMIEDMFYVRALLTGDTERLKDAALSPFPVTVQLGEHRITNTYIVSATTAEELFKEGRARFQIIVSTHGAPRPYAT